MDFLVHDEKPGAYDAEITERDARIFICSGHRNLLRQWYGLWHLQRQYGPYDIIHSHVDYYGGFVVLLAKLAGVRVRIANSHNDTREHERLARPLRRLYIQTMKFFVRQFATGGLGVSVAAASSLFGENWEANPRWLIHSGAVDLDRFCKRLDRDAVRAELGIPPNAIVFGHVGRFVEQKNHEFLVRIAEKLVARDHRARFLLVGGGPLQQQTEDAIRECGLEDHFIILAPRDDVPRLMLGAMDVFLFPSRHEGLPLALVEAQAAGLRCFVSTAVSTETVAVQSLVSQLSLAAGPEYWAEAILRQIDAPSPVCQEEALRAVENHFDIRRNAAQLVEFYQAVTR
jgi:glycosyltransferase involved in cell wall biosynthesis